MTNIIMMLLAFLILVGDLWNCCVRRDWMFSICYACTKQKRTAYRMDGNAQSVTSIYVLAGDLS